MRRDRAHLWWTLYEIPVAGEDGSASLLSEERDPVDIPAALMAGMIDARQS